MSPVFISPMVPINDIFRSSLVDSLSSAKQRRNYCSGPPTVYQDLSTRHDWPVKKAIVDLTIRLNTCWKRTSGNLLSP